MRHGGVRRRRASHEALLAGLGLYVVCARYAPTIFLTLAQELGRGVLTELARPRPELVFMEGGVRHGGMRQRQTVQWAPVAILSHQMVCARYAST